MQRKWLVHIQQWQLSSKTHLHLSNLSLQIPTIDKKCWYDRYWNKCRFLGSLHLSWGWFLATYLCDCLWPCFKHFTSPFFESHDQLFAFTWTLADLIIAKSTKASKPESNEVRVSDLVGSDIRWWSGLVGEKAAGGVVLIRIQKTNHLLRQVLSQQAIYKRIRTTLPSQETSSFSWSNTVGPQIKSIVKEEQTVSISFFARYLTLQDYLGLSLWLILRCWGKSSILCQQNSDAL